MEISDEDFETIYRALKRANEPYTHDEVDDVVAQEAIAWRTVQRIRGTADPSDEPRPSEAAPTP